jgi:hypothetical protein
VALTKTTTAAQASATNTGGSTTTGSWIDVSGAYESSLLALITNGGTGPTLPCTARVDLSPNNGTTVYLGAGGSFAAGTAASAVYSAAFPLGGDAMYARVVFSGNTGQSVTVQADITRIAAL